MTIRPMDEGGDVLPVLRRDDLPRAREALVMALRLRLRLLKGDWSGNPEAGLPVDPASLSASRAENGRRALAAEIASWLSGTAGVAGVRGATVERDSGDRHALVFRCSVVPENGAEAFTFSENIPREAFV